MEKLTRREFVRRTSAAGLLVGAGGALPSLVSARPASAVSQVTLGETGINASFLAFGTGVDGYNQSSELTRMGLDKGAELLRYGFDRGINLIDTADLYGTHQLVPMALGDVPRDKYVILTKVWPRPAGWFEYSGGASKEVDRFRTELKSDYIDILLLHCLMNDRWTEESKRAMDELSELKERGVIRSVGVSCHDFGAMEKAASHPWVDVLLARINNRGGREFSMDGSVDEVTRVLQTAKSNGKAVIGMKIYGVGKLSRPDQMSASLKYVVDNQLVDAVTIGMLRREHIDDNLSRISSVLEG